nr:DUF5753 domain-containing protein [Nocardiopsis trehalosi]
MAASPTLRRRRLAAELRRLREDAGLTAKEAAAQAKALSPDRSWFESKVTRIETRKILKVRDVDLLTLLDVYGVTDEEQREAYRRLAREASLSGWWVGYRDVLGAGTLIDLETEAARIRTVEGQYIPGLLQTEGYARAVISNGGITDESERERRVEARMMRQHILHRPDAPRLWAIVDEAAFHRIPADLVTVQVSHLINVQRADLRVQVLPFEIGPHPAMDASFLILDFDVDPSTVYLEQSMSALFHEDPLELRHYETVYDHIQAAALSVDDSRRWMAQFIESRT